MLSSDINVGYQEKPKYDPIPADVYPAELLDIRAVQEESWDWKKGNRDVPQYILNFTFDFVLLGGEQKGKSLRGWRVSNRYIPTMLFVSKKHGKNKLFKIIEALIGRELTQAEYMAGLTAERINSLVGKQCRVLIEHTQKEDGNVFANATNWLPANSPLPALTVEEKEKVLAQNKEQYGQSVSQLPPKKEITADEIPF